MLSFTNILNFDNKKVMDNMVESLCECILQEASKPEFKEKFKVKVLNPCTEYLGERIYPYVLATTGVITVMVLLLLVILLRSVNLKM
jgi:hypothetical protein